MATTDNSTNQQTTGVDAEPEVEAEVRPSEVEIVLPPFVLLLVLILGLMLLSLWTRREAVQKTLSKYCRLVPRRRSYVREPQPTTSDSEETQAIPSTEEDDFFTEFDIEVLDSLSEFHNRPIELMNISLPAVIPVILYTISLYIYDPLVVALWPDADVMPDVNEAIGCFLMPAGLVYATTFGFAYQQALVKQSNVVEKISYEFSLLDQIVTLATKLSLDSMVSRMNIYRAVKTEAVYMALQIENRQPSDFKTKPVENVKVKLWSLMDILRKVTSPDQDKCYDLDRIVAEKIVEHMLKLNSICSDRMGPMHSRIHPVKWVFLESLGFFSFFGILLITVDSYRMELTMSIVTVASISLLCYVVSDFDSPFAGIFRIDVSCLHLVVQRAHAQFLRAKVDDNTLVNYHED